MVWGPERFKTAGELGDGYWPRCSMFLKLPTLTSDPGVAGVCPSAVWDTQSLSHLVLRKKGGMVLFVDNVSPLYINPYLSVVLVGVSEMFALIYSIAL